LRLAGTLRAIEGILTEDGRKEENQCRRSYIWSGEVEKGVDNTLGKIVNFRVARRQQLY
jgi:hypothetical protein